MKQLFINLALLVVLTVVFSGLSGCSGSAVTNINSNNSSAVAKTNANESPSAAYPPLPTAIAQTDVELLDGSKLKIADRKGKVVLLNLWATWCGPCRGEMPHLIAMQDRYRDKGFQVLGLDVGDGEGGQESIEDIKSFSEEMKLNYELARISNEMTSEFYKFTKFSGVPLSVLVDREGHVRGVFLGGGANVLSKMKETVDKLMSE